MNIKTVSRPDSSEFAEYYGLYIDRVPDGDITELMLGQIDEFSGATPNTLHLLNLHTN